MLERERLRRILVVDDEPRVLRSLSLSLHGKFDLTVATSGKEALELLENKGPILVVVADLQMPGMSGTTFLEKVRRLAPDTVRILLTGSAGLDDAITAINKGYIFRLLTKPCTPEVLAQALEDAFEQYLLVAGDRLLMEAKLESLQEESFNLQRLALMGATAGSVGHEMNNILQVMTGTLGCMEEEAASGGPLRHEHIHRLTRVAAHLKTHADGLLHLARTHRCGEGLLDLCEVVEGTLTLLKHAGGLNRFSPTLVLPGFRVWVQADRTRIEQVLVNLMRNACDALAEAGDRPKTLRVRVESDAAAHVARCSIEDSGCGIPADALSRIFEPYFTSKPPDRGTGLGLPVVKQIIEGYRGSLRVVSEEGIGSTFAFELPMADTKTTPPQYLGACRTI